MLHILLAAAVLVIVALLRFGKISATVRRLTSVHRRAAAALNNATSLRRKDRILHASTKAALTHNLRLGATILAVFAVLAAFELVSRSLALPSLLRHLLSLAGLAEAVLYALVAYFATRPLFKR